MGYWLHYAKSIAILIFCLTANVMLAQPDAGFDFTVGNGTEAACAPITVSFTNNSTNYNTSVWTVDGTLFSSQQDPIRIFVAGGIFNICLEVNDGSQTDQFCQQITVNEEPILSLTQVAGSSCNPNEVSITLNSNNNLSSIFWDFGDGTTMNETATGKSDTQIHTYSDLGNYTVTANVIDANGCMSTIVEDNLVAILEAYSVDFNSDIKVGCTTPLQISFTNTSDANPDVSFVWDFGDGNTSTDLNPIHIYQAIGAYTVTLTATNNTNACVYEEVKNNYIYIGSGFAEFTTNEIDDGDCDTKVIEFTLINGTVNSANWDFGDGTTSTDLNPTHTYLNAGCYSPNVSVLTSDGCADTSTASDCIQSLGPVSVSYSTSAVTTSCDVAGGLTVSFFGNSATASTWEWDFGDGGVSNQQNPSHTFTDEGSYSVNLMVSYPDGCKDTVSTSTIDLTGIVPNFSVDYREGCAPLPLNFTDLTNSSDPIVKWNWDFGNGITSTDQNPAVTLPNTGSFDVTLVVETASGCSGSRTKPNYINIGQHGTIDFTATPSSLCVDTDVVFTNNSSDNYQIWEWDFGDGGTSNEFEPEHEYQDTGRLDVMLIAIDNACRDTLIIEEYITVDGPIAKLNFTPVCGGEKTVAFRDTSILADDWLWDFGDGTTSTDQHPTHTYADTGLYQISLTVNNIASGCQHIDNSAVNIVNEAIPSFSIPKSTVCLGDTLQVVNTSTDAVSYDWIFPIDDVELITEMANDPQPKFVFIKSGLVSGFGLKVTDANGCTSQVDLADVISVSEVIVDFSTAIQDGCAPYPVDFTEMASTNLGGTLSSFLWDYGDGTTTSDQNPTYTYPNGGSYDISLTVTNDIACSATLLKADEVVVDDPVSLFSFTVDDCANSVVSFTNSATSINNINYLWDFGDGNSSTDANPNHSYLTQDSFIVCLTVTNSLNCLGSVCDTLDLNPPIAEFIGDNLYKSCPEPPLVTTFTDNSIGAVSWEWDFGDGSQPVDLQSPSHSYSQAGNYTVCLTVTNQYGCVDTNCKTDYIKIEGPKGTFDFTPVGGCNPLEVIFTASGTNIVEYNWDFGDGAGKVNLNNTGSETITHTYTTLGQHTPVLLIKDASGCKVPVLPLQPVEVETITLDLEASDSILCEDGIAPINFSPILNAPSIITSYSWEFPGSDTPTSTDASPSNITYPGIGSYDVILTVHSKFCTMSITKSNYIVINTSPDAAFNLTTEDGCAQEVIRLQNTSTISSGTIEQLNWDAGNGKIDSVANPAFLYEEEGTYTISLEVTSDLGCTNTHQETTTVRPGIIVNMPEAFYICKGDSVQLAPVIEGTNNPSFDWTPVDGLSCTDCPNPMAKPAVSTMYYATVSSPDGCIEMDSVFVELSPYSLPEINLMNDTFICKGDVIQLFAEGGITPFDYQWDSTRVGLSCYTHCFNPIATPELTTTYFITVIGEGGCVSTDSVTIEVIGSELDLLGEDRTICEGDSIQLNVAAGTNPVWTNDYYLSCGDCLNPIAHPRDSVTLSVTVDYDRGCTISEDININVYSSDDVDAGMDTIICLGTTAILHGTYGNAESTWTANGIVVATNERNPEVSPEGSTLYTLAVTEDLCTITDTVRVDQLESVEIFGGEYNICEEESVQLEATGNAFNYQWIPTDGLSDPNIANPVATPEETIVYQVVGTTGQCIPDTALVSVYVHKITTPDLPKLIKFGIGDELRLNAEVDGISEYDYLWNPLENLSCIVCPKTVASPDSTMTYEVEIKDVNYGCKDTASVLLQLITSCEKESLLIPNAFSPNDDDQNDVFYIRGSAEITLFKVFDRWGELVFETTNGNNGWDGKYLGENLNRGVYIYYVEAVCRLDGSSIIKTGDVTLIR